MDKIRNRTAQNNTYFKLCKFPITNLKRQKDCNELEFDAFLNNSKHRCLGIKREEDQYCVHVFRLTARDRNTVQTEVHDDSYHEGDDEDDDGDLHIFMIE
jgi:hypothetical protein